MKHLPKRILLLLLISTLTSSKILQTEETQSLTVTEKNVKLIGRYYLNNDVIWLVQSGSAVEFYITGTYAEVVLNGDSSIDAIEDLRPRYGVYLNDEILEIATINDENHVVKLFENDTQKTYKVKVMLLSENMFGGVGVSKINVISNVNEVIKPTEKKKVVIEFIGDSITCGYGVEGADETEHFKTTTENFSKAYAYLTAQALNVDYSVVSYSGYGVISGYTGSNDKNVEELVPDYYELVGKYPNYFDEWDFNKIQPNIIVINLGTNDYTYAKKNETKKAEFVIGYTNFLMKVRKYNPNSYILCTLGILGGSELFPSIEQAISIIGDKKIFSYQFPERDMADGLGSDWHPSALTQQKSSALLITKIKDIFKNEIPQNILLTEQNVKLIGRYYQNNDITWLVQSGSAVEFSITGKYLEVVLAGDSSINADANYRPRYGIFVDDEKVVDGTLSEESKVVKVFDYDDEKNVKVKVMLSSENMNGGVGVKSINVISSANDVIKPVDKKKYLIEFIGDSITCGYGVDAKDQNENFKTLTEDFSKTYAYLTAQTLDIDYSVVAFSGHGVLSGSTWDGTKNTNGLVPKYYTKLGRNENYPGDWDFENHQPDFVVINLGTNDNLFVNGNETRTEEFIQEYVNFLTLIRSKNPKAVILCILGIMGADLYPSIEKAVKLFNDKKVYSYQLPVQNMNDGLGADWHPSVLTHQKNAVLLSNELKEIIDTLEKTQSFLPTEENVKLIGRYYKNNDIIWLIQSGSAVEFNVIGSYLEVVLAGDSNINANANYRPRYGIFVDDERVFDSTMSTEEIVVKVFESEDEKNVKVKVMLLSENMNGGVGVKSINVISTANKVIKPVDKKKYLIEFMGDSITCGYGVDAKDQNENFKTLTEDFSKTYAYLTAQNLEADYSTVSYSGHGIISGYSWDGEKKTDGLYPKYYTKLSKNENYPGDWDFENHQPEFVVINLGTNDNSYVKGNETKAEEFIQGYVDFLTLVRSKNPKAIIVCILGIMGGDLYPSIQKAISVFNDKKVYSYQLPNQNMNDGLGADWHPSALTHQKSAVILTKDLQEVIDTLTPKNILLTEKNVKLIGRNYKNNDITWLIQSGSAVEFSVISSYLEVVLVGDSSINADANYRPRYGIFVDDERVFDSTLSEESKVVKVFESDDEKNVKVKVMLLSENMNGGVGVKSVNVISSVNDVIKPVDKKKYLIEFVGDSITCGYGVDAKDQNENFKTLTENFSKTYAYLAAQALDADYSVVAFSGHGIISGYSGDGTKNADGTLPKYYTKLGRNENYPGDWDFENHQPDFVVINLGTNDNTYVKGDETKNQEFIQGYIDFLSLIRSKNPKANILCVLGILGADLYPSIEKAVNSFNDKKVYSYQLPVQNMNDGLGADWHPSAKTHQKNAVEVVTYITKIIASDNHEDAQSFLATEENVKLIGRYYQNNDVTWLVQSGSAVEFYVTATYLEVVLAGDSGIYNDENYRPRYGIYLDDELFEDSTMSEEEHKVKLLEVDTEKKYKVKIMLLSENGYGAVGIKQINIISTQKLIIEPVEKKKLLIEFVGDSITCGYGVEAADQNEHFQTTTENFAKTYAYLAAETLNADYTVLSYSGHGIVSGFTSDGERNEDGIIVDKYTLISENVNYPGDWDFENHQQPNVIVINLGTNDNNYVKADKTVREDEFTQEYANFLEIIRKNNPDAYIICTVGILGATEIYPLIQTAITLVGDEKISSYLATTQDMSDGLGADWHPSAITHQKASKELVEVIKKVLGY